jgi:hypothetical protein
MIGEEIADHPSSACRRQPAHHNPVLLGHMTAMQAHLSSAGLATLRQGELVHVRAQVPHAVKVGGRRVRDQRHIGIVTGGKLLRCWQNAFASEMTRASWTGSRLGSDPPRPVRSEAQARPTMSALRCRRSAAIQSDVKGQAARSTYSRRAVRAISLTDRCSALARALSAFASSASTRT